jgi:hypothetical protein
MIKIAMILEQIVDLMNFLEDEFETHYIEFIWVYFRASGTLMIKINYPLTKSVKILESMFPIKADKQYFDNLKNNFVDEIYAFINKEVKKLGYNNIQERRK